jgi:hypothetical protein
MDRLGSAVRGRGRRIGVRRVLLVVVLVVVLGVRRLLSLMLLLLIRGRVATAMTIRQ